MQSGEPLKNYQVEVGERKKDNGQVRGEAFNKPSVFVRS